MSSPVHGATWRVSLNADSDAAHEGGALSLSISKSSPGCSHRPWSSRGSERRVSGGEGGGWRRRRGRNTEPSCRRSLHLGATAMTRARVTLLVSEHGLLLLIEHISWGVKLGPGMLRGNLDHASPAPGLHTHRKPGTFRLSKTQPVSSRLGTDPMTIRSLAPVTSAALKVFSRGTPV